jgi:branched-chain amino acid transport system permease protein
MTLFIQQIINGLILGGSYTLIALGLTMIYGILYVANFAHGPVYMLGAFVSFFMLTLYGFGFFSSMLISMVLIAGLGIVIERLVFRPLRTAPHGNGFIAALGLFFILEGGAAVLWGHSYRSFPTVYPQILNFLGISLSLQRLLVIVVTVGLIAILYLVIQKTTIGRTIRAVAQDSHAAVLVGISVDRVSAFTFAIGSALAAAAGTLLGPIFLVYPAMGAAPIVKAFVVIILGGMGSIPGAILGGFILGIAESLGVTYISSTFMDLYAFGILIIILMFKPRGLMG